MNHRIFSKPIYISSGEVIDKPLTGFICSGEKRTIVRSISVNNETPGSGYVSLYWRDVNSRMPASAGLYPLLISGYIPPYGRLKALDDYVIIEQGEPIIFTTLTETTGNFTALISIIEQDLNPEIITITPKTFFFQGAAGYEHSVYTVPSTKKATVRSITVNNDANSTAYSTSLWTDNNNYGIGSTINDYVIYKSGTLSSYGRLRGVQDVFTLQKNDVIKVYHMNDVGNLTYVITVLEEDL